MHTHINRMFPLRKYSRALGGAFAACFILVACLTILSRIPDLDKTQAITSNPSVYVVFFSLMLAIYLTSFLLWKIFARANGLHRSDREGLIDMGLLTLGKYLPGKVWGILARGAVNNNDIGIRMRPVIVSASEQSIALAVGTLLLLSLMALGHIISTASTLLISAVACTTFLMVVICKVFIRFPYKFVTPVAEYFETRLSRISLIPCYCFLWILSASPIVVLAYQFQNISGIDSLSLATAFMGAMIFGWIAFFAPGGIGVREAMFLLLSPSILSWEQNLFIVTLHRSLSLVFDLALGLFCCSFILFKSSGVSEE